MTANCFVNILKWIQSWRKDEKHVREHLQRQLHQKKFLVLCWRVIQSSWLELIEGQRRSGTAIPDASHAVKQYTFTCRSSIPLVKFSCGFTDVQSKIKFTNVTDPKSGSSVAVWHSDKVRLKSSILATVPWCQWPVNDNLIARISWHHLFWFTTFGIIKNEFKLFGLSSSYNMVNPIVSI